MGTKCLSYDSVTKDGCDFLAERKIMFEDPAREANGVFYVETATEAPYAQGW